MSAHPDSPPAGAIDAPADDDHPELAATNARSGLWLFGVYLALYGGFVGLSAFAPDLMAKSPFGGGLNLAVLYGFFLIVAALILALIYMAACRRASDRHILRERGR